MTETIFAMPNHHVESCGTPPEVVGTQGAPYVYHGYFENCHREQWIFTYDYNSKEASLIGGDVGWEETFKVENGWIVDIILNEAEREWLSACWKAVTAIDYSQAEEVL